MKKETLTFKNIKKDSTKYFLRKIISIALSLLLLPIVNFVLLNIISLFFNPTQSFKITFSIVFFAYFLLLVSYETIKIIISLVQIKNEKFIIASDWVIEKKPRIYGSKTTITKPYRLIFANSGTYSIPYGKNYTWSCLRVTSDKTLYDYTEINDEFYIISTKVQKNIAAYNKKHFELEQHP